MDHKENDFRKICFHCASIYEMEDGEILTCPVCGRSIPSSEYERVMKSIRQAVFRGNISAHIMTSMKERMLRRGMPLWKRYLWIMFLILWMV